MAEAHVPPDFAERLAATVGRRLTERAGRALVDGARARAPAGKAWVTAHDELVRYSHAATDGQLIPENIPYRLPPPGDDNAATTTYDYAMYPRDPSLPIAQRINCRCASAPIPGALAAAIHADPVTVAGTRASVTVTCRFPGAPESEAAAGGGFMLAGAHAAADSLRAASTRR